MTKISEKKCLEAVRQNGHALQYVQHRTEAVCLEAANHGKRDEK